MQEPEHGEFKYAGAVASHASPRRSWYPDIYRLDASRRYFDLLDRLDVSNRYMRILCAGWPERKCAPVSAGPTGFARKHDQIRARLTLSSDVRWRT
jgi:hypothetical protein